MNLSDLPVSPASLERLRRLREMVAARQQGAEQALVDALDDVRFSFIEPGTMTQMGEARL